ncbi:hypothetical protein Tco_1452534 [Tanacetum coccineum]
MTSAVGEQWINDVKPTAYWAWRPKIKMINHVYKNNGSCICKQFNYVDPTGRNKVLNSPYFMVKSWLVQDQTVLGQTTTGKETSNPLMAGSLPKTIITILEMLLLSIRRFMLKLSHVDEESSSSDFRYRRLFDFRGFCQTGEDQMKTSKGDLKLIFDPNGEDDIWLNQQYWELLRWKLHEYSGVHSLLLDGTSIQINMLVDKKYPLKKEILKKMINLKIEAEESDMASELIKFIKSQIAKQS